MPLFKQNPETMIELTKDWKSAPFLWQKRASIIALRSLVKNSDYIATIAHTIDTLLPDDRRFIQTGIGWTISDLSKYFPEQSSHLVEKYLPQLSLEVINRHTKHLPKHQFYKQQKRLTIEEIV